MTLRCIGGTEVQLQTVLTLALDGGEWSASCPDHLNPMERSPSTHTNWNFDVWQWSGHTMSGTCLTLSSSHDTACCCWLCVTFQCFM